MGLCLAAFALALTGCDDPEVSRAKDALQANLKDPGSVQYEGVKTYSEHVVCGKYNAKNELGGYVGFKQFITMNGSLVTGDDHANFMILCNDGVKKAPVDVYKLSRLDIDVTDKKTGKTRTWSASTEVWVEDGKRSELYALESALQDAVKKFLATSEEGLSSLSGEYDFEKTKIIEKALQKELQKQTNSIEIKGVNLTAY
ncbi:hypothetical protein DPH57_15960 [Massilia sp. YMA4]|nr:hypothetical protein DPH57_15960 [Massilia sp. YMA4]